MAGEVWWRSMMTPEQMQTAEERARTYQEQLMAKAAEEEARTARNKKWWEDNRGKTSVELDEMVYNLRKSGKPTKEIAHDIGVTISAIHVRIKRHRKRVGIPAGGYWS